MTPLVPLVMFGFIPFGMSLFKKLPPRIAAAAIFVAGWIFLPQAKYDIPVLPDYTKGNALGFATLIAVYVHDRLAMDRFKLKIMDVPMLCWCLAPVFSSVTNGLGLWDGLSAGLGHTVEWGIPYYVGRIYFGSYKGMQELALIMFIGGLAVAPLAVVEMIISPQLHIFFYGWYPHDFSQTKRYGGWRPSVFMEHGLELAMWMAASAFVGWQLLLRKAWTAKIPMFNVRVFPAAVGLLLVFVMCRSAGALMLWIMGMGVFFVAMRLKTSYVLLVFLLVPLIYMNLRAFGLWDGQNLIDAAGKITGSEERSGSLSYRLYNESLLVDKASERLLFGWAGNKRSFVTDSEGRYISVPDGMWILTLGKNGVFGLTSLTLSILLAPLVFLASVPQRFVSQSMVSPALAFATFLGIFMIDNLLNAMYNPLMMVGAGGLASLVLSGEHRRQFFGDDVQEADVTLFPAIPQTRVI